MSFDIPAIHIPDNSPEAEAAESVMATQHVGIEEAVRAILRNSTDKRTPAQRMIGLLSSEEDVAIMDEVREIVTESRIPRDILGAFSSQEESAAADEALDLAMKDRERRNAQAPHA